MCRNSYLVGGPQYTGSMTSTYIPEFLRIVCWGNGYRVYRVQGILSVVFFHFES